MKFLLVLVVIVVAAWLLFGRRGAAPPAAKPPRKGAAPERTQNMLACAHCGVHLPDAEALQDADGRPFCSEAHRLAGPR